MSLMSAAVGGPSHQPYQCHICQTRFTRLENLKRHAALHSSSRDEVSYPCGLCQTTFSRRDLRHRHLKRKHPEQEDGRTPKRAHLTPGTAMLWGEEGTLRGDQHADDFSVSSAPLGNDGESEMESEAWPTDIDHDRRHCCPGRPLLSNSGHTQHSSSPTASAARSGSFTQHLPDGLSPRDLPYLQEDWFPTPSQVARGVRLFFAHIAHYVPFLHQPTFDGTGTASHLVLSMLCLAYQHDEDPDCGEQVGSGASLSLHCYHRARVLASMAGSTTGNLTHNVTLVQTYLLLQICAMMYLCGDYSASGLKMHSEMVSLARFGGLTQRRPAEAAEPEDLEALWREFVNAESSKRTLLAAHQIDALWYQLLSIPRSLSHLELKHHDLPCPEDCWTASSSAQWAHRQLVGRHGASSVQYADALQRLLSAQPEAITLPAFDPYGAINIAQFLISSAREVSGWSTMTGRLSMERSALLKSSLVALEPFSRSPTTEAAGIGHAATCEVTWEMAMIELDMWSLSHTCGIVAGSVDAVLMQSTCVASSHDFLIETDIAQAIQPRIDWFLRYLDAPRSSEHEAPWVTVYAYKAFLIAWQLLRNGSVGAMAVVGVDDGDVTTAIKWARDVFHRRQQRQLGQLIVSCLDILDVDGHS
ncbi:hypothetical protein LTR36_008997 [Oleoguttula mirabilis]|uniref:C2H2-type domain-containing protein n=1 Tax=Oleoguttula mirabilis TaxID=1507867 RepID=A0AAV9J6R3_9PEZI|nr:hypothetical protein LTR36_008997 [Oleoguttula mirabilis]